MRSALSSVIQEEMSCEAAVKARIWGRFPDYGIFGRSLNAVISRTYNHLLSVLFVAGTLVAIMAKGPCHVLEGAGGNSKFS